MATAGPDQASNPALADAVASGRLTAERDT